MVRNTNSKPGDETRRNGDYIGLPHPDTSDVALSNVTIPKGRVVTYDGTDIAEVTGDNSDAVTGVVYEYNVYGGNQGSGNEQLVRADRDATVLTRGAVAADLTAYVNGTATVAEGATLGANGRIEVVEEIDASNNLYEVLVR